jgi:hypothetical protein
MELELARLLLLCMSSGGTSTPLRRHSSRSILQLASDSCAYKSLPLGPCSGNGKLQ